MKTKSTGGNTPDTTAKLAHSDDQEEAMQSVTNVLNFLACAFGAGTNVSDNASVSDGLSVILETCADTLRGYTRGAA